MGKILTPPAGVFVSAAPMGGQNDAAILQCLADYSAGHGLEAPCGPVVRPRGGKPYVAGGPHFSVSHSGEYWACAVHIRPVGLDIQLCRPGDFAAIARRVFTAREAAGLAGRPDMFYPIWCTKEAWVKLHGTGIARGFGGFSAVLPDGGLISTCQGNAAHWPALAQGYQACLWAAQGYGVEVISI